jgi:hypothetical protein
MARGLKIYGKIRHERSEMRKTYPRMVKVGAGMWLIGIVLFTGALALAIVLVHTSTH